jgi:hypothetical protein
VDPDPAHEQDLADLCGTTVETAIRVMTRALSRGVVRSAAGPVILNRERLTEIARSISGPEFSIPDPHRGRG